MSADLIAKTQLAVAYERESLKLYHRRKRWWYSPSRRAAIDGLWRDCCDRARQLNDEIRKLQEDAK